MEYYYSEKITYLAKIQDEHILKDILNFLVNFILNIFIKCIFIKEACKTPANYAQKRKGPTSLWSILALKRLKRSDLKNHYH